MSAGLFRRVKTNVRKLDVHQIFPPLFKKSFFKMFNTKPGPDPPSAFITEKSSLNHQDKVPVEIILMFMMVGQKRQFTTHIAMFFTGFYELQVSRYVTIMRTLVSWWSWDMAPHSDQKGTWTHNSFIPQDSRVTPPSGGGLQLLVP